MTVEDKNVIDIAYFDDATKSLVLVISDHLEWNKPDRHIRLLEQKIARYIDAVQSGEIFEQFPHAKGQTITVMIVFHRDPGEIGVMIFNAAREKLRSHGLELSYKVSIKEELERGRESPHPSNGTPD